MKGTIAGILIVIVGVIALAVTGFYTDRKSLERYIQIRNWYGRVKRENFFQVPM